VAEVQLPKNPLYQHTRVELFLAERNDEVVGRVAVTDDDNHDQTHGDSLAFFGFFEAEDEEAPGRCSLMLSTGRGGWDATRYRDLRTPK
jgi:D-lyxose ketol-isomerase